MEKISSKDIRFALDVGTRSIIGTVGVVKENKFHVILEKYVEHEERAMIDGQIHDIDLVAKSVKKIVSEIEEELNIKLSTVAIAAAGRFLRTVNASGYTELNEDEEINKEDIIKLELIALKEAEKEINKNTGGKLYCVGYSVKNYYLNGYLISNLQGHKGENASVDVIATFLPRSVVDSLYTVMNKVGLSVSNLTLEPIAAIEAVVPKNLRLLNIALVDIGAGTSDIAISSKDTVSSYGMVPLAGDEVTEAIVQEYLVDFNTAENIKRQINLGKEITYIDVLGLENTIQADDVRKVIKPIVSKLAEGISTKIIELNANKPPSALFLVGGGAHTPGIIEELSEKLNMPVQRIAIKDRKSVIECISENDLGSAGITVLGIALVALKNENKNFIDVTLNGSTVSMFNSHEHTVMDVIIHAGINPNLLMVKNGKNLRYKLNGVKRIAFGEKGKYPVIKVNDKIESIDKHIKYGDNIEIEYAKEGKDAKVQIKDVIRDLNTIGVYLDDKLINLEPIIKVNDKEESLNYEIKENDEIWFVLPKTIKDIKEYILKEEVEIAKNGLKLEDDYIVSEGEKLNIIKPLEEKEINTSNKNKEEEIILENKEIDKNIINVIFNNKNLTLSHKKDYIIIDVFNYVDYDLSNVKGKVNLTLNGENVGYTAKIKDGDVIELFIN
ncbi:cell division protein FtsA [Caproiciproducens sp. MSJ-32]|uniref:cell division protein FtsA n=1 Tax=Caproiciproducens sp. MSJ-32 TaxID=2841527 RepID=UPI001C0FCC20|nr:cell division protein FtsA [Caproiciproducens sp. MSJ-32]MBU5453889.1 cell division protein FtsA [Caproiciproducens sp. MSJ-32]